MKSWCDSSLLALLALLVSGAAGAASDLEQARHCLAASDVACAHAVVDRLLSSRPEDPEAQLLAAQVAFHEGRFDEALALVQGVAPALGGTDGPLGATLKLYGDTVEANRGFVSVSRDDIVVRYAPGVDRILVDEALDVMTVARESLATLFGATTPQGIQVEIYPNATRFILASGLGEDAVETTGVVALSKWSRLLMTSPRALALGYTWKDTLVHEYIHQVVAYQTQDQAPVWLQEGLAHHFENWWRGEHVERLSPMAQSLLARALAQDDLVTFDEMHPSFAFLPSAERAVLAYAQVKTLVEFALSKGGSGALEGLLSDVRAGMDARKALARAGGYTDFDPFMADALVYLRSLDLVEHHLASMPTVLGQADGYEADPLLGQRADLAGFARLGDLLREAGRPQAALVEYGKARPDGEPESPMLSNRIARCHMMMGQQELALTVLQASVADYPDYGPNFKHLGELELRRGREAAALDAYRRAADINPYDPELQGALATLYSARGDAGKAEQHARYLRILRTAGGSDEEGGGHGAGATR